MPTKILHTPIKGKLYGRQAPLQLYSTLLIVIHIFVLCHFDVLVSINDFANMIVNTLQRHYSTGTGSKEISRSSACNDTIICCTYLPQCVFDDALMQVMPAIIDKVQRLIMSFQLHVFICFFSAGSDRSNIIQLLALYCLKSLRCRKNACFCIYEIYPISYYV